jgi:outer membrane protein TolC
MFRQPTKLNRNSWLFMVALIAVSTGCRSGGNTRDVRFNRLSRDYVAAQQQPAYAVAAANPVAPQYSGPHSVEEYLELGLSQNPEIEEARLMVESLANRVPQAASLPDPMLGMTAYPSPVQTAAGEQDFALSMNQKVPWNGKLETRAAVAQQDVNVARANLAAVELKVVERIKNAYYQLYFIQQAISITKKDQGQLELIGEVVEQMYVVKRDVTQQDVLQVQVALARLEADLANLHQQKESAQAKLASLLHVSPETKPEALDSLPPEQTVQDIQQFYETAIEASPEMHAQLASIEKDRRSAALAELENYPDLTYGFSWVSTSSEGISPVANGDDAFMLTLGMNLPVYGNRIDAGVREAQTRALANAKKYDRLKDEKMEVVADLFAKIKNQQENLRLFRKDIIPKQELTLEQSVDDYQVGKVDFLQMIENWRQLLQFHITEKRFETDLQQTLASLAREIGSFELPENLVQTVLRPMGESENGNKKMDETN